MGSTSNPGSVLDDKLDTLEVITEYSRLMAFSDIATLPTKKSTKLLLPIKLEILWAIFSRVFINGYDGVYSYC